MPTPTTDTFPAVFRAGDIGVSSEWRDISYDWSHILTKDGVAIYTYLRDTYDHQRSLRPFILTPDGPTKTKLQHVLGYRTSWPMDGPEFLLQMAGLLHVEIGYGQSADPERPQRTRVAYYTVGRLDHPVLDWAMLDRLLDGLMIAIQTPPDDPTLVRQHKKAQAALRSLGQSGMFQHCDPDDLFYEYGAWPTLLPTLIMDERWEALFSHLHGLAAVAPYRQQARAWVEWVQRNTARLQQENDAIGAQLVAAQRRGTRGGGSSLPPVTDGAMGQTRSDTGADRFPVTPEAALVTQTASGVTSESLPRRQPVGVARQASVTNPDRSQAAAEKTRSTGDTDVSLRADQLTDCCDHDIELRSDIQEQNHRVTDTHVVTGSLSVTDIHAVTAINVVGDIPLVEPHLRDAELSSTRQDAFFWCEVQRILYGTNERYAYKAGEKQAAHRRFKQQDIPIGVVLAALRAMMTLPPDRRPRRFDDALKLDLFHACVQQALALLPARAQVGTASSTWPSFLDAYRRIGQGGQLRDVSTTDYHVLYGLFSKQPDECWEVLNRAERASVTPDLSPSYLRRAIVNNGRAAAQAALQTGTPACSPDVKAVRQRAQQSFPDSRRALLQAEGLKPQLLTDQMTDEYLRAWIAEADARRGDIRDRRGWLAWGIASGVLPHEHPKLPQRHRIADPPTAGHAAPAAPAGSWDALWQTTLDALRQSIPVSEYETWLQQTTLLDLDNDGAIIGTANIFARDHLAAHYGPLIADALSGAVQKQVAVQFVIA